jgi:excisionase family DNA binding protein
VVFHSEEANVAKQDEGAKYMTVGEARERLGVTKYKMTRLIKDRHIPKKQSQRDKRAELVPRDVIEQIAREFAQEATE